jgi:hypothetical protein
VRRAPKVDANQGEIVAALKSRGCLVQSLAGMAGGVPDLLVGNRRGHLILMEVKDGSLVPSARELAPDQVRWHAAWRGFPVYVVKSVQEALDVVGE